VKTENAGRSYYAWNSKIPCGILATAHRGSTPMSYNISQRANGSQDQRSLIEEFSSQVWLTAYPNHSSNDSLQRASKPRKFEEQLKFIWITLYIRHFPRYMSAELAETHHRSGTTQNLSRSHVIPLQQLKSRPIEEALNLSHVIFR
jgi:hypothetical protein